MQVSVAISLEQLPCLHVVIALAPTPHIPAHIIKKFVSTVCVVILKRFRNHSAECGVELNTCEQVGNTSVASDHYNLHSTNQLPDNKYSYIPYGFVQDPHTIYTLLDTYLTVAWCNAYSLSLACLCGKHPTSG
nr:MAG TPA: hypothetical protein [Caudoviricetes sp.]